MHKKRTISSKMAKKLKSILSFALVLALLIPLVPQVQVWASDLTIEDEQRDRQRLTLPPDPADDGFYVGIEAASLQRGNDAFLSMESLQPLGTQFNIAEILEWTPEGNPDSRFNRSRVPLAPRRTGYVLNPFANPDAMMVFSGDAYPIGGTATHSYGTIGDWQRYAVNFWQYIGIYNFWGGPINIPTPELIDAARRNGVPVVGTVFFENRAEASGPQRQMYYNQGTEANPYFPFADKLWEIAEFYGFDGWFFNFEAAGVTNTTNLAGRTRPNEIAAFLMYMQETKPRPDMILTQYDSPASHNTWTYLASGVNAGAEITAMGLNNARGTFLSALLPANLYKIAQNVGTHASPSWRDTADFLFGDYKWVNRNHAYQTLNTATHPSINVSPYRFTFSWPLHMEGYLAIGPSGSADRDNGLMSQSPWVRHSAYSAAQMADMMLRTNYNVRGRTRDEIIADLEHTAMASLGIFGGHAPINFSTSVGDFLNVQDARLWSGYRGLAFGDGMPHDPSIGFLGATWNPNNFSSRGLNPVEQPVGSIRGAAFNNPANWDSDILHDGVELNNMLVDRAEAWHGFSQFLADQTPILDFPFVTHFNPGIGHDFFVNGVSTGLGDWSNRGIQCLLPTWRWTVIREGEDRTHPSLPGGTAAAPGTVDILSAGNPELWEVTPSFDDSRAWWGGASINLRGNTTAQNEIRLYSTFLNFQGGTNYQVELITTSSNAGAVRPGLYTAPNYSQREILTGAASTTALGNGWYSHTWNVNRSGMVYGIGLFVPAGNVNVNIGRIRVAPASSPAAPPAPSNLTLDGYMVRDLFGAEARIFWDFRANRPGYNYMFEIYQVYENGNRRFLNATFADAFFVSNIDRDPNSSVVTLEVVAVDPHLQRSAPAQISFAFGMTADDMTVAPAPAHNPNLLLNVHQWGRLRWSSQNEAEPAQALFDGNVIQTKWCIDQNASNSNNAPFGTNGTAWHNFRPGNDRNNRHWVVIDTITPITVERWRVYHAGPVEATGFNTANFALKYIPYGTPWHGSTSNRPPSPWARTAPMFGVNANVTEAMLNGVPILPGPWELHGNGASLDIWSNVYAQYWQEADRVMNNPESEEGNITDRDLSGTITARYWKFYVDMAMWRNDSNAVRVFGLELFRHPKVGEFMPLTESINADQVRVVRGGGLLINPSDPTDERRYDLVHFRNLPNSMPGTRVNLYRNLFDTTPYAYSTGNFEWVVPGWPPGVQFYRFNRTAHFNLELSPEGGRFYFDINYENFARSNRVVITYFGEDDLRTLPPGYVLDSPSNINLDLHRFGHNFNSSIAHVRRGAGENSGAQATINAAGAYRLWRNQLNMPATGANHNSPWILNRHIWHGAIVLDLPEGTRFFIYQNEDDVFPSRASAPVAVGSTWARIDALEFNNAGGSFWVSTQAPGMPESVRIRVDYDEFRQLSICFMYQLRIRYEQVRNEFPPSRAQEFTADSWEVFYQAMHTVRDYLTGGGGHQPDAEVPALIYMLNAAIAQLVRADVTITLVFTPDEPDEITAVVGDDVTLDMSVEVTTAFGRADITAFDAGAQLTFQWLFDDEPIGDAVQRDIVAATVEVPLELTDVDLEDSGAYVLRVSVGEAPFAFVAFSPVLTLTVSETGMVDRDRLRALIAYAEALDPNNFTPESWTASEILEMIDAAKAVYENQEATPEMITDAYNNLRAAIAMLRPSGSVDQVFGLHAFNNGVINNQSLANNGIIRIWTRLDGANALVPNSLTVTAIDQSGGNAMDLVRINQPWANPGYVNYIDVNFNAPWTRIYLTATVLGQTVELVLVNPRPPVVSEFSLHAFNNGTINNQSLANAGLIRIWTRLDGVNALVPNSLTVTAIDQNGRNAMEFVRVNQPAANPGYVNLIDVNFNAPWERIYLTATVLGQTVELVLVNPRPPVVPEFSLNAFNNGVINNQSLADAGLIRIWTRLDGVNANVLITEITAVDQSGNDAMQHLRRINTVGVSAQNGFDVNFNAPWQRIYLTVTAYGQTIELTLTNPV